MEEQKIIYLSLNDIKEYENNPRVNDEAANKVAESIKEFGFRSPLILDKNNVIVCGHTRYKASKILNLDKVPCIIASDLNEKQIDALRIADNKVSDYSIWDNKLLLEELNKINFEYFTGFSISDLFVDELNEGDNSLLDDNENGVEYIITIKTQNKELSNKIEEFLRTQTDFYGEQ